MDIENLQYPIGKPEKRPFTDENKEQAIQVIEQFPNALKAALLELEKGKLDEPYRPDGWTRKQVVHHCADSHMNALIRFKLALTEDTPTIKAYDEKAWATLPDSNSEVDLSIQLLVALHAKWATVLRNMEEEDFKRAYYHPEKNAEFDLGEVLLHYEWHCNHHLAHIKS